MPTEKTESEVTHKNDAEKTKTQSNTESSKKVVVRRNKVTRASTKPAKTVKALTSTASLKPIDVTDPKFYLNREINWVDFDRKVLGQASDTLVPILERVKFLSIFYNNLDEFFMVRVANVWKQVQSLSLIHI